MPPKIYNAKNAKKVKKVKKANLRQGANAKSATTKAYSTTMGRATKGGRRGSPPGGFNPPPPEGGARRARSICFNPNIKHQTPTSNTLLQVSHEIFVFPLPLIPPQEPGDHRSPAQDLRFLCLVGSFWSIFSPSETRFKNGFEKPSKKVRKTRILASQNPSQTLRKSPPNRRSKKTAFFHAFFV